MQPYPARTLRAAEDTLRHGRGDARTGRQPGSTSFSAVFGDLGTRRQTRIKVMAIGMVVLDVPAGRVPLTQPSDIMCTLRLFSSRMA